MINSKWNLTLVGGFVLLGVGSLVLALAILAGRTGDTDTYYTRYANVSGLKFGSQVLFEGYPVGQVEQIEPVVKDGQMLFKVSLSVLEGWKIPEDSVARSEASGLLAPQTIVIVAGRSQKALKPGDDIISGGMGGLFSTVQGLAGNVDQLTDQGLLPLVDNLNRQVTFLGKVIDEEMRPLIRNTNQLMLVVARDVPPVLQSVRNVSGRAEQFLSPQRVAAMERIVDNTDKTMANLRQASDQVEKASREAGPDVTVALREFRLSMESLSRSADGISQNLDSSARNLQEFSHQIRRNPGVLLRGSEGPLRLDGPGADTREKRP
ncbi:MAG TPA: MlaD family protein [Solimonas sp.]|nr:MlaD family protein [Solimonas sp.]